MRYVPLAFLVWLFLLSGWTVAPGSSPEGGAERQEARRIALDLTDLDIPGPGGGDEMELPPIQGTDRQEPAVPSRKPVEVERRENEVPAVSRPVPSPAPGMAPFLLDEAEVESGTTRVGSERPANRAPEVRGEEFPAELKALPPPPSRAESLKLPPGMDASASVKSDVPEIPWLEDEGGGQQGPLTSGRDGALTMKPFPDLRGTSTAGRVSRPSSHALRPEDTLQVREDIDAKLIDLFERYYKDR